MSASRRDTRDWLFRGLMFEADAERFRQAGIRVGADAAEAERSLLEEALAPFGVDVRNEALLMARLYAVLYCFEGSVRSLIRERLEEKHGHGWWSSHAVPQNIRRQAESRLKDAEKNSWLEGDRKDILGFVQFGELASIITANWDDFADLIPTQHWLKQRFDDLEKVRNFLAHNRFLLPGEFQRVEMYVSDWNRIVAL